MQDNPPKTHHHYVRLQELPVQNVQIVERERERTREIVVREVQLSQLSYAFRELADERVTDEVNHPKKREVSKIGRDGSGNAIGVNSLRFVY